jgi:hypothetical protein
MGMNPPCCFEKCFSSLVSENELIGEELPGKFTLYVSQQGVEKIPHIIHFPDQTNPEKRYCIKRKNRSGE